MTGNVWGYDIKLFNVYNEDEILLEPELKIKIKDVLPKINNIIHVTCKVLDSPIILEKVFENEKREKKIILNKCKIDYNLGYNKIQKIKINESCKNIFYKSYNSNINEQKLDNLNINQIINEKNNSNNKINILDNNKKNIKITLKNPINKNNNIYNNNTKNYGLNHYNSETNIFKDKININNKQKFLNTKKLIKPQSTKPLINLEKEKNNNLYNKDSSLKNYNTQTNFYKKIPNNKILQNNYINLSKSYNFEKKNSFENLNINQNINNKQINNFNINSKNNTIKVNKSYNFSEKKDEFENLNINQIINNKKNNNFNILNSNKKPNKLSIETDFSPFTFPKINPITEKNTIKNNNINFGLQVSKSEANIFKNKSNDLQYYNTETNFYKNKKSYFQNYNTIDVSKSYDFFKYENLNQLSTQIKTINHMHGLVLLLSNMKWRCKICLKNYTQNDSTYYCSLYKYNICNNCIGNNKKYPLKIYYHQQTKLKEYFFSCHEHSLIYCRTSRSNFNGTNWICNLCKKNYGDKIWSFYCTFCDYDICLSCSRKYILDINYITKMGIKIDNHLHDLIYMITNRNWICNLCSQKYDNSAPTYYCTNCDYDVCESCMEKLSDEKKYPLFFAGNRLDYNIKVINVFCHEHPMIYCITSRNRNPTTWICNKCLKNYKENDWSFYCSLCDYDLCYSCYKFNPFKI